MVSDFNKKGNREFFNDELLFKTVGIFLLVFVFFMIIQDVRIYQKKSDLANQIKNDQAEVKDLQKSSATLKSEIANADSQDYLEKLGYEQFGQTKPGETEYMFVRAPKKNQADTEQKGFWGIFSAWLSGVGQWLKK